MTAEPEPREELIAQGIARRAHAGQIEEATGDDFIHHVERVVGMCTGTDRRTVAWLHDVIEQTNLRSADLCARGISHHNVVSVVRLTRLRMPCTSGGSFALCVPTTGSLCANCQYSTYAAHIERIKQSGDQVAIDVKVCDLRDHLRPSCPASLMPRYKRAWSVLRPEEPLP